MYNKQQIDKLHAEYMSAYTRYYNAIKDLPHTTVDGLCISIIPGGMLSFEDQANSIIMTLKHTTVIEIKKLLDGWLS